MGVLVGWKIIGVGSHYGRGDNFWGQTTASGQVHQEGNWTAAMREPALHYGVPLGAEVSIINLDNGLRVDGVIINDRGPYDSSESNQGYNGATRIIDVNSTVADALGFDGTANLEVIRTKASKK